MPARILHIVMLILAPFLCQAQRQVYSGKVKDAGTGEPIAGAFVSLYSQSKTCGYSMTSEDGTYSIGLDKNVKPEAIRASLIGYAPYSAVIYSQNNDILMKQQKTELKSSKVIASAIETQGDTTRYLAKAFSDGTERNIGDLLAKLPGVEVTESGGLVVEGKSINKFYVDGMDLMGAQYGTIVKNLTPDKILSVEVYKRHQPIKALLGLSQSDRDAVNIILKESNRGTWLFTGNLAAGAPDFPLFEARGLVTRFASSRQNLFMLKGNDIGKDVIQELNEQEYFGRRTGGFIVTEDADSDFSTPLNPSFSRLQLPKETWYDNSTVISSLNDLKKTSSGLLIRSSLSVAHEKYSEQSSQSETVRFKDGGAIVIEEDATLNDKRSFLKGKVQFEKNDSARFFSDDISFSGQLRDNHSGIDRNLSDISQSYSLPAFKVENTMNTILRISRGRAIRLESDTKFISNKDKADYDVSGAIFSQIYNSSRFDSHNNAGFDVLFGRQTFHMKAMADLYHVDILSSLSGLDSESLTLSTKTGIWHLMPGASLAASRQFGKSRLSATFPVTLNYVLVDNGIKSFFPTLSPSLSLEGPFCGRIDYHLRGSYSLSRSKIESLSRSVIATSYRNLSLPDSLRLSRNLTLSAGLNYSDNVSMVYSSINSFFYKNGSDKVPSSFYHDSYVITEYIPFLTSNDTYGVNASLKKYFGLSTMVVEVMGGARVSDQNGFLQGADVEYKYNTIEAGMTLRSNPCEWFSGELKTDYESSSTTGSATMRANSTIVQLFLLFKPVKSLSIKTECYQSWYGNDSIAISNDPIISMETDWRFKAFSVFARIVNLLDIDGYSMKSTSAYHEFSSTRKLLGRRFLVGIQLSM